MIFVYLLEGHSAYAPRVRQIRKAMNSRGDSLYTSCLTVGEILVAPYKQDDSQHAQELEQFFDGPAVTILQFGSQAARHYARIRASLGAAPADAIHLACAAEAGIDLFLTNDSKLVGKIVPGIQFIAGLSTDLL